MSLSVEGVAGLLLGLFVLLSLFFFVIKVEKKVNRDRLAGGLFRMPIATLLPSHPAVSFFPIRQFVKTLESINMIYYHDQFIQMLSTCTNTIDLNNGDSLKFSEF